MPAVGAVVRHINGSPMPLHVEEWLKRGPRS